MRPRICRKSVGVKWLSAVLSAVAFGKLEDQVPSMPDEAPPGLEEPLPEARQGPALDGKRQHQSTQEIAERTASV
jgi:hypothetical protein